MAATIITAYLGEGLAAARPATPAIDADAIGFWFSTDTGALSVYANGAWTSTGGGYTKGTVPTVVQHGFAVGGGNSVTLGGAPTSGNLLVAMCFNPTSDTIGSGWTKQTENSSGSDYGFIATKVAGGSESATQSPVSGVSTTGGIVMWEIHGQAGSGFFAAGGSQTEQSGTSGVPVLLPNVVNCLGLSAVSLISGVTITSALNIGTSDVLDNSGSRCLAAGHTDLGLTPMVGILANFSGSGSSKAATCLITS